MAVENITVAYTLLKDSVTNTTVFGLDWILPTALIIIVLVLITRDINKWKILAFPTSMLLGLGIGLWTSWIIITILGIVFAVEALSTQTIGQVINVITKKKEKEMIRTEYVKHQKKEIRRRLKSGLTDFTDLLNRDINKSVHQAKSGFSGFYGRRGKEVVARDKRIKEVDFGYDPTTEKQAQAEIKREAMWQKKAKSMRLGLGKKKKELARIERGHKITGKPTKLKAYDRLWGRYGKPTSPRPEGTSRIKRRTKKVIPRPLTRLRKQPIEILKPTTAIKRVKETKSKYNTAKKGYLDKQKASKGLRRILGYQANKRRSVKKSQQEKIGKLIGRKEDIEKLAKGLRKLGKRSRKRKILR